MRVDACETTPSVIAPLMVSVQAEDPSPLLQFVKALARDLARADAMGTGFEQPIGVQGP